MHPQVALFTDKNLNLISSGSISYPNGKEPYTSTSFFCQEIVNCSRLHNLNRLSVQPLFHCFVVCFLALRSFLGRHLQYRLPIMSEILFSIDIYSEEFLHPVSVIFLRIHTYSCRKSFPG